MATQNIKTAYNKYRPAAARWDGPLSNQLFGGKTSDGGLYAVALGFAGLAPYRIYPFNGVTLYLYRFDDGQANTKTWTYQVASGVNTNGTVDLVDGASGSFSFSAKEAWKSVALSAAAVAALKAGNNYIYLTSSSNGQYAGIRPLEYSSGAYAAYVALNYTPEPAPTTPTAYTPGTATGDSVTLDWSDCSDTRGHFTSSQLMYDVQLSLNGGSSWGQTYTTAPGQSSMDFPIKAYVGYQPGVDLSNNAVRYRVRTHTSAFNGVEYYSAWATSGAFTADYRFSSVPPGVPTPGTITGETATFDWADVSSQNGVYADGTMCYELMISLDGGNSWGTAMATAAGASQLAVNMRSYLGLQAGRYYINPNCRIAVRSKSPNEHYSGWTVCGNFAVDYRIAPSQPAAPSPSKAAPYEGETITVTLSRPSSYNELDNGGNPNQLTYIVWNHSCEVGRVNAPCTQASAQIDLGIGNWTAGSADLSSCLKVLVRDTHGQDSSWSAQAGLTVRRFREPVAVVTTIPRTQDTATIHIAVTDTGYGGPPDNARVRRILYKLASGDITEAPIGPWAGMSNSFTLANLSATDRYALQVQAVNAAPDGTPLSDKTGPAYAATILEYSPATYAWHDKITGGSGFSAKALIVGSDYGVAVDPGWGVFQNGLKVGANSVWHAGNFPRNPALMAGAGDTGAFWRATASGSYCNEGGLAGAPSAWGLLNLAQYGGSDYFALYHVQPDGDLYYTGGNGSTSAVSWKRIWSSGNFDPASKADAGHAHSYLPLSGGSISGNLSATGSVNAVLVSASTISGTGQINLPSGNGTAYMVAGGGDAAGYSANTLSLACWNGMGFYNPTSGGAYPNAISGYVDFRNGFIDMKGGFRRNGKDVWDETNLITAQGSVAISGGAWTNVSFGKTFPSYPRLALSTTHATSFPKVRAVTTTGCQVCLDGTASGTVCWTAIYTA